MYQIVIYHNIYNYFKIIFEEDKSRWNSELEKRVKVGVVNKGYVLVMFNIIEINILFEILTIINQFFFKSFSNIILW